MHSQNDDTGAASAPVFPDAVVIGLTRVCGALSALLILVVLVQITTAVVRRYVLDPAQNPSGRYNNSDRTADWALLVLDQPLGRDHGLGARGAGGRRDTRP